MLEILITILLAIPFAELVGYTLHKILHSHRIKSLGQAHMIHHMRLYGPQMPLRSKVYKNSTTGRFGIMGLGVEWIGTLGLVAIICIMAAYWAGIPGHLIAIFVVTSFLWALFFYNYMHDAMHIEGFWMIKNPYLSKWFLHIRGLHDIHHRDVDDLGRMNTNYGICFFVTDRIFGTYCTKERPFNKKGYAVAEKRYKYILS